MFSNIVCKTIDIPIYDSNPNKENNFGLKLYNIELSKLQSLVASLTELLSVSERHRADRYHFLKDRNRFIICRAMLKILLSEYLNVNIIKVIIETDSKKKPYLPSHPSLFFNVSHAGDQALISIAKHAVGVDIEYIDRKFSFNDILPTIFSSHEINEIVSNDNPHLSFYKLWTKKEAIVKAMGKGIDDEIKKVPVTDGSHFIPASLLNGFETIKVLSFNVNTNYIGALAISTNESLDTVAFTPLPDSEKLKLCFK